MEPVGVVGGVVLQIMLHPLDVLPVGLVDFDDRSPVAVHEGDGQAIIVDVLALELSSPSGGKLGVGRRVQELSSELAESNPLGGPLEGENFEDPSRRSIFVEASLLFLDPANLGVWVGAVDALGMGHNRGRRARCRCLAALLGELFDRVGGVGTRGLGVLLDGINLHRGPTVAGHLVNYRGKSREVGCKSFE